MPSFSTNVDVEVEFEVFCGTCGAGLCNESDTRHSRNRNTLQVTVNLCPNCKKQLVEEQDALEYRINTLKERISELENELHTLNKNIDDGVYV